MFRAPLDYAQYFVYPRRVILSIVLRLDRLTKVNITDNNTKAHKFLR